MHGVSGNSNRARVSHLFQKTFMRVESKVGLCSDLTTA